MKTSLLYTLALVGYAAAPVQGMAQGIPTGSTKVAGSPDSAFTNFLAFLKTHGASVVRTDSIHKRVEAKVKGSDESILFAFVAEGDSTAINAQGTKGSMTALIFGLGVVNDWLESGRTPIPPVRKPEESSAQRRNKRLKLAARVD